MANLVEGGETRRLPPARRAYFVELRELVGFEAYDCERRRYAGGG